MSSKEELLASLHAGIAALREKLAKESMPKPKFDEETQRALQAANEERKAVRDMLAARWAEAKVKNRSGGRSGR